MTQIISYEKDDISKEIKKLQIDCKINDGVIEDLETMERTPEVKEALKKAYKERERLDKLTVSFLWA